MAGHYLGNIDKYGTNKLTQTSGDFPVFVDTELVSILKSLFSCKAADEANFGLGICVRFGCGCVESR